MIFHKHILALVLCCCPLAVDATAWAAGKHKPRPGKASSPAQDKNREGSSNGGSSTAASSKTGNGSAPAHPSPSQPPPRESVRQESRIEFDERMLKGQSAAGVIYLFQRTPSDWKSIVEVPDGFRARTVNVLAPSEEKK